MPTISELVSGKIIEKAELTTTYRWNGKDYPLPQDANIQKLCNTLVALNENKHFVPILVNGMSESGKSTLVQTIIHRTSCLQKPENRRIVKWIVGKDLFDIKKHITELPKNKKYAIILDDQSFVIDQAKPKQKKEIMEYTTVMRKDLGEEEKVKAFLFTNIHYGRATPPMLRDGSIRILTSMSDEDTKNWYEGFGWDNQWKIKVFQKQYGYQMNSGVFYVHFGEKAYRYAINSPFRIALVKDFEGVRSLLFPKEGCEKCAPPKHNYDLTKIRMKQQQELKDAGVM